LGSAPLVAAAVKLGTLAIPHPFTLAPMEEHTSFPFRVLARQHGASLVVAERLDAADVATRDKRALKLLHTAPHEQPCAGQISGADPAVCAEAARVVEEQGFAAVDLNFECPIRRLLARGEGGALMAQPELLAAIVAAVVRAVSIPVTVKLRSGPDDATMTAADIAQRVEQAGAAGISLHARSVQRAYAGGADWAVISAVKAAVSIPLLGGGGIRTAADAVRMLRATGCDGVAIGRGCLGEPWIFKQARALHQGSSAAAPTPAERGRALLALAEAEWRFYGPHLALRRLPRVACYFAKNLSDFAGFRDAVQKAKDLAGLKQVVAGHFR
jgi:nifR3 family TIM-barrel protein